ncbi:hypothetical protein GPL21_16845 [Bradyrhizobium pachyrhizi]|uniref:DUF4365 domain-containing protein n=1 Tax=Bradyrhizobium pachyrhizi TaxID=280333 RepID=A0A844SID1_9BRAD|nr:hypothetical protein [Bradyrhizobium pachyrhizi]MVT66768.1 hypothetical protein [Bradyrhizobium pachyrhizi]
MIVDLAEWAEDKFSELCSRAGVTRNKSVQDRTGWDYLVEFPPTVVRDAPGDLQPVDAAAHVQVKSKRTGRASVPVKLSNALRFAKNPLPCFVVLFLGTQGGEPVRIFAKHFWEREIREALKRAREAHAQGREDLHKLTLTLSFDAQDEHSEDLLKWMEAAVTSHGDRYVEVKGAFGRTLGFEEGAVHGSIRFNIADLGALVDHQIGLAAIAPPINITIRERRFGINSSRPLFEGVPSVVRMQSLPHPCRVRVRGGERDDIWLDGKLFAPALPNLPLEFRKLRVIADFLEIMITGQNAGHITLYLDPDAHRSLTGLRAFVDVLKIGDQGPLQIQISCNGRSLPSFSANLPIEQDAEMIRRVSDAITGLEKASVGALLPELTLSLSEISQAWNSIVAFNDLVTSSGMSGTFTLDRDILPEVSQATSIYFYDYVDVGAWTFMAVVRRQILALETEGPRASFKLGAPRVIESIVRQGRGEDHLADLRKLYASACKIEGDGVLEFNDGDYRALTSGTARHAPLLLSRERDSRR